MRFGAPVWPFKWDTPYDEAIKRIGSLGFRAVELIAWDRDALDTYYTPETIKQLRSVIEGEGLVLSQFVSTPGKMASRDPKERAASVAHMKRLVDVGMELGAQMVNSVTSLPFNIAAPPITDRPHVQVFTVDVEPGLDWDQNWLDYVDAMRQCAKYAESAGTRYSLEPHPFRYGGNTDGMLRLLDAVGSPALGVNFDPSHTFPAADFPNITIYRLNKRIFHCDFSDNDGTTNVHWRPGKGKIDWDAAFRALKDIGYNGVVSLEFEDVPGVSRGVRNVPGVYKGNTVATPELDREYRLALEYLTGIAQGAGFQVE
jgi:sugar phosphate isomerase/epimerase